jgi:hypothetical protein
MSSDAPLERFCAGCIDFARGALAKCGDPGKAAIAHAGAG